MSLGASPTTCAVAASSALSTALAVSSANATPTLCSALSGGRAPARVTATRRHAMAQRGLLQQVAAHEMGHALGIEHHIAFGNLMALYTDEQSPTITSADVDAFNDVR